MKKRQHVWITAGGIILIVLGIFHAGFWEMFDWQNDLPKLSVINSNILQILNICLITLLIAMGVVMILCRKEIGSSKLGRALLWTWALFFVARGVTEFLYPESSAGTGIAMFLVATVFLIPAIPRREDPASES